MALNCGWEILLVHRNGNSKSTCGRNMKECVLNDKCDKCEYKVRPKKAYDIPTDPGVDYFAQAGDAIWASLKK